MKAKEAAARIQTSVTPKCIIHESVCKISIPVLIKSELGGANIYLDT
jgi:hypothetical protein